jgi:hypothetical protein
LDKISLNFERDNDEFLKIFEYLNKDRRTFMLTAHAKRKTYEDFYKEKIR